MNEPSPPAPAKLPAERKSDPLSERGVAYVLDDFPIRSERFVEREVDALRRLGIRVPLCLVRSRGSAGAPGQTGEIYRVGWPAMLLSLATLGPSFMPALEPQPLRERQPRAGFGTASAFRLRLVASGHAKILRQRRPGLIHAHFATVPVVVARYLAASLQLPWGVSVHAGDLYAVPPALFAARLQGAAYVVTCSSAAGEAVRQRIGGRTPVFVVHHGLNLDDWPKTAAVSPARHGAPRLLAVGRFVQKKNFGSLVAACALLKPRYPGLNCAIVGDGPLRGALQRAITRSGAPVVILPWQTEPALQSLYRSATVLVAPGVVTENGDRDNISNVIVEAMASGLPVVSGPVSSHAFGAEDAEALITADPSPSGLAGAIDRALSNPSTLESAGNAGRRLAERRFDLARNAHDLARIFRGFAAA